MFSIDVQDESSLIDPALQQEETEGGRLGGGGGAKFLQIIKLLFFQSVQLLGGGGFLNFESLERCFLRFEDTLRKDTCFCGKLGKANKLFNQFDFHFVLLHG